MGESEPLSPRVYAAEILLSVPVEKRESWIAANVPEHLRRIVRSHLDGHEQRVRMFTDYVMAGGSKADRSARLERAPLDIRAEVRAAVTERFASIKAKREIWK